MNKEHIETRTPEEMLQQAYDRCIACGEYYRKLHGWDKVIYDIESNYVFDFDPGNVYKHKFYHNISHGVTFPKNFFAEFRRVSDGARITITKYSEPPTKVS